MTGTEACPTSWDPTPALPVNGEGEESVIPAKAGIQDKAAADAVALQGIAGRGAPEIFDRHGGLSYCIFGWARHPCQSTLLSLFLLPSVPFFNS